MSKVTIAITGTIAVPHISVDPDPVNITSSDTIEWEVQNKTGHTIFSLTINKFTNEGTGKPADPFGSGSTYTFFTISGTPVSQTTGQPLSGPTGTVYYKYAIVVLPTGPTGTPVTLDPRVVIAY